MENLNCMRTFVRVADVGSFSEAARQSGVAPSSVSRQVNDLEDDLGVRLFHRSTRKLSLTEAGELYYERVARITLDVDEAKLAVSELGSPSGILRLAVPSGVGRELVISAIPAFLARHAGIKIVMSMTDDVVDAIAQRIDVAIRMGELNDSSLRARKIGESRRIVCASPRYLEKNGKPRRPEDLEHHSCLTWRAHPGHNVWKFRGDDGLTTVNATGNFFAKNADAIAAAAVAGLGFCLLPDWNIAHELRQKQLTRVLKRFDAVPSVSPVWAVHTHQRHVPPKIRAFIDFLVERFGAVKYS